jgi:ABC-type transport system substrate-binding protein
MTNRIGLKFVVLPMILALVLALAAACSGDDDGDTTPIATQVPAAASTAAPVATTAPVVAAKPVIERVVIGALTPSFLSNNIGRGVRPQSQFQLVPMYDYLIGTDAVTGLLQPQLAESWTVEPNGVDFRIKLREGIPFHDGSTLSWRDIERTVTELGAEDSEHTHQRNYKTVVIEPISELEFIWKLPGPLAEQVRRLSQQVGGMEVMGSADYDASGPPLMTTAPTVGTGAYRFLERDQTSNIVFERVDYDHWLNTPEFQELEMRWLDEESTRLAALLTGEVHITQIGPDSTERAVKDGMLVSTGTQQGARIFGGFQGAYLDNTDSSYEAQGTPCGYTTCDSPWLIPEVRKAMNKALDKDALNEAFFRGDAQNMIIQAIPESSPAFNPAWKVNYEAEYGFDPAASRALLESVGFTSSSPLEINVDVSGVPAYSQAGDMMESMAGMWEDIGIKLELKTIDNAAKRPLERALMLKDWIELTATASFDVQSTRVHMADISPRGGGMEPIKINALIKELQKTMDTTVQDQLLRQIGDIAHPAHVAVNLFWVPPQIVLNPEFVDSWVWPGNVSGLWSHFEMLRAHKK